MVLATILKAFLLTLQSSEVFACSHCLQLQEEGTEFTLQLWMTVR